MVTRAFVRQVVTDGADLDVSNIVCPNCKGNTIVLSGNAMVSQREIMESGVITERSAGSYEEGAFDLKQIDCMNCDTQFIIKDHELFRLEQENLSLKGQLAKLTGKPEKLVN